MSDGGAPEREKADSSPTAEPECRGVVSATVDAAAPTVREAVDTPVVLVFESKDSTTALIEGSDTQKVVNQLQEHDVGLQSVAEMTWCEEPLCDANSKVQFSKRGEDESAVEEAFPDAVRLVDAYSLNQGDYWVIYSRVDSRDEIIKRLEEHNFDTSSVSIQLFTDCERIES